MTKDEAFAYMQQQAEYEKGVIGFMIVPMRGYDIERFCDDAVCERFKKLTPVMKTKFLSKITDEMSHVFEWDSDWTALDLLYCARDSIEDEYHTDKDGLIWMMDKLEKEDKNG